MTKTDENPKHITIKYDEEDERKEYLWETTLEYKDGTVTDDEINEAKLMAKLLVDTHRQYYEMPPSHVNIYLRDISILNNRHIQVEIKLTNEYARRNQGFKLSDFDWEFEEVLASHFGKKRFELDYDSKKKYNWRLGELDVGGYEFVIEAIFDIK